MREESATNIVAILHQQHRKLSRYSGSFVCKETRSSVEHFHKCSTLLQVDYLQITKQDQPIYIPHKHSGPTDPIETIGILPPTPPIFSYLKKSEPTTAFNKPLILYQFQINIQPSIHQASGLVSISEHYPA